MLYGEHHMSEDFVPESDEQESTETTGAGIQAVGDWTASSNVQHRRTFLRNTLVASAAAAAAIGGGTALAAQTPLGPKLLRRLTPATTTHSPLDPSALCIQMSALPGTPQTCFDVNSQGNANPGDYWLFFTIRAVAPGDYLAKLTQSTDGGATQNIFTTLSTPFQLTNANGMHVTVGGTLANCPTTKPAGTSSADDPVAVHVSGSTQDVQIAAHIKWNGGTVSGTQTFTFNGQLTSSDGSILYASPAAVSMVTPCPA
jgi:hypothetical protein